MGKTLNDGDGLCNSAPLVHPSSFLQVRGCLPQFQTRARHRLTAGLVLIYGRYLMNTELLTVQSSLPCS